MALSQDLSGRHAVVTGGTRGLGRAIANRLAVAGASITVIDLDSVLADADMPADWGRAAVDLGSPDCQSALESVAARLESTDIVVANAGVVPPWRGMRELDADEWQRVMAINVWGVAATIGTFAPALAQSDHASVVVMASLNGYKAHPKQVLYTASKHAVVGVMRAAALDLGSSGIRVNALAPGPIATDALVQRITDRHSTGGPAPDDAIAALNSDSALGKIATAEQVAAAAHFLASDASGGLTGAVLPIDCGLI